LSDEEKARRALERLKSRDGKKKKTTAKERESLKRHEREARACGKRLAEQISTIEKQINTTNKELLLKPEELKLASYMYLAGHTIPTIASNLNVSEALLRAEYGPELARFRQNTDSFVVGKLLHKIRQGDNTAIIFYLKMKCKWSSVMKPDEHLEEKNQQEERKLLEAMRVDRASAMTYDEWMRAAGLAAREMIMEELNQTAPDAQVIEAEGRIEK
jgi:hypothetical protein